MFGKPVGTQQYRADQDRANHDQQYEMRTNHAQPMISVLSSFTNDRQRFSYDLLKLDAFFFVEMIGWFEFD